MAESVAIVQARTGSSRLPGKVMYPLDGEPTIFHVLARVSRADCIDQIVLATSYEPTDDVLNWLISQTDTAVFRGSENDVLGRIFGAATEYKAEYIVRITGDCPLLPPEIIDSLLEELREGNYDHVGTVAGDSTLTVPNGLGAEAFTYESLQTVHEHSDRQYQREHVTPYYRENPDKFDTSVLRPHDVEGIKEDLLREDIRLTMDVSEDYRLLKAVYENVEYDHILDLENAIMYIKENDLGGINSQVEQKGLK